MNRKRLIIDWAPWSCCLSLYDFKIWEYRKTRFCWKSEAITENTEIRKFQYGNTEVKQKFPLLIDKELWFSCWENTASCSEMS